MPYFLNYFRRKIFSPSRRTSIQNHHITSVHCLLQSLLDLLKLIRHNGINDWVSAPLSKHCGKNRGIKFQNVTLFRVCTRLYNFVTGWNNSDYRPFYHFDFQHPGCNHRTDSRWRHFNVCAQNHLSCTHILTDLTDMLPGYRSLMDCNRFIWILHQILHHNHRIISFRYWVSGVQHNKLLRLQNNRRCLCSAKAVFGYDCDAIHSTGCIMRRTNMRINRLCCDSAACLLYGNHLCFCSKPVLQ